MKDLALSSFNHEMFGEVRIIDIDGNIWFVANDVAKALGYEKPNNAINAHCRKINKFNYPATGRELNIIPESDVYKLIMRSELPEAERFQDWVTDEVLPSIRKTGSFSVAPKELSHFEQEMLALKYAGEILNLSDVSKLGMMQRLFDVKGFDKAALPTYIGKQRLSASASKLLEDRGKPMSTIAFNQLMVAAGLLEEKERKSSHGSVKKFKALTGAGLVYGENLVSPKNDREVQPYYYEDSFDSLLDRIKHLPGDEND